MADEKKKTIVLRESFDGKDLATMLKSMDASALRAKLQASPKGTEAKKTEEKK